VKFKIGDVVILSDYSEFQDQKDWFPGIIDNFLKNNDEFTYQVSFLKIISLTATLHIIMTKIYN